MANAEQLKIIRQGKDVWNKWRIENPKEMVLLGEAYLQDADLQLMKLQRGYLREADLRRANLRIADLNYANLQVADISGANLEAADLSNADLSYANICKANLRGANLISANLTKANLSYADLSRADLRGSNLSEVDIQGTNFSEADLSYVDFSGRNFSKADLSYADLSNSNLSYANFSYANLSHANLNLADLMRANLSHADLSYASLDYTKISHTNLSYANLSHSALCWANLVETNLEGAILTECEVYGISAWGLKLDGAKQNDLIITPHFEPVITVDNLEIAQFIYLLLHNEKIRDVIDTLAKKAVLILGRFTPERKVVLDTLRIELRNRGYLPILFDFNKPNSTNFTETIRILAGMSMFVIADISSPKSSPLELQATIPNCMVPFVPIIRKGEKPFSMFKDLYIQYKKWVLKPLAYNSVDHLISILDTGIIEPAKKRNKKLLKEKTAELKLRYK